MSIEPHVIALADAGPAAGESVRTRLGALLAAVDGADAVAGDTPGARNQRLLRLHARLIGERLEACAACPECGETNEFDLPTAELLGLPAPAARVPVGDSVFRVPLMADLDAVAEERSDEPLSWRVTRRCRVEGASAIDAALVEAAGAAFEAADPAAVLTITIACAHCDHAFPVAVDIALLVGEACARLAESLLRDVDTLASAYGWTEPEVLALPAGRRRRYVALVAARRSGTGGPRLVERRA